MVVKDDQLPKTVQYGLAVTSEAGTAQQAFVYFLAENPIHRFHLLQTGQTGAEIQQLGFSLFRYHRILGEIW